MTYEGPFVSGKEGEKRSRIRALKMDNLMSLLGIMKINKILNARVRGPCGIEKIVIR